MTRTISRMLLGTTIFIAALVSGPYAVLAGAPHGGVRGADNPVQAVRGLIHDYYVGPNGQRMQVPARFAACAPMALRAAACPITARLLNRLRHPDPREKGCLGSCGLDPVGRTQNATQYLTLSLIDNSGSVAHVKTFWTYAYNSPRLTFVVRHGARGWLVDDEYCSGHPGTTIYKVPVRPCPNG